MSQDAAQSAGKGTLFIVIRKTGGQGPCQIIPEGDNYPAIYTKVYGPASMGKCEAWVAEYCRDEGEPTPA